MAPQKIVDPGGKPVRIIEVDDLPEAVRNSRLKVFPDPGQLILGDFLLFQSTRRRVIPAAIETYQLHRGYSHEHARWYHVGLYAGEFLICDAQRRGGVRLRSLAQFVKEHNWRVLRLKPDTGSATKVLELAKRNMGKPYAYWRIPLEVLRIPLPDKARQAPVCSSLCADALYDATGEALTEYPLALPADVSISGHFDEVQVDVVGRS